MTFRDLSEFFDGSLRLPVGGKTYVVPPISAQDGLWAQQLLDLTARAAAGADTEGADTSALLDDDQERNLYQRTLGPVYDELIDDGVGWPQITRCGVTAYLFFTMGEEAATRYWETGSGEAPAPSRAVRRAAARSTPSRGSATGTTSSPASKPRARQAPAGSPSSSTGRS